MSGTTAKIEKDTFKVDASWIPPEVPEIKTFERSGVWLCMNPKVPAWLGTGKLGSVLLQLADGVHTVQEIHTWLNSEGVTANLDKVVVFFQEAYDAKFFMDEKSKFPLAWEQGAWANRKLGALYVHLTDRCNLSCSYCYRESSPQLPVHHTPDKFIQMFEYVKPFTRNNLEVTFSGGEPLVYKGFKEVVATSTRLGYRNKLLTNGTRITDDLADFIKEHFFYVKISVDGPNEEIHSQTRGKGNFNAVIRGISRLAERKVKVGVQVTVTKSNLHHAEEIFDLFEEHETVDVKFTPMFPMGRGSNEEENDFINSKIFHGLSRGLARATGGKLPSVYVPGRKIRGCFAGSASLSIADTGEVYPCQLFHSKEFNYGNIFHDKFEDIFFNEKIQAYVKSMDVEENNSLCRKCHVRFLCGGGCKANSLHGLGDYKAVDLYCGYLKKSIVDALFSSIGHYEVPAARPEEMAIFKNPENYKKAPLVPFVV